jgi:hypothetical protein
MVIKYTKIFHCKTRQNLPKIGIFGLKTNHLATLVGTVSKNKKSCENQCDQNLFFRIGVTRICFWNQCDQNLFLVSV